MNDLAAAIVLLGPDPHLTKLSLSYIYRLLMYSFFYFFYAEKPFLLVGPRLFVKLS